MRHSHSALTPEEQTCCPEYPSYLGETWLWSEAGLGRAKERKRNVLLSQVLIQFHLDSFPLVMDLILLGAVLSGAIAAVCFALARRRAQRQQRVINRERKFKSAAS